MFQYNNILLLLLLLLGIEWIMGTNMTPFEFYLWCLDQCWANWQSSRNRDHLFRDYRSCVRRCETLLNL